MNPEVPAEQFMLASLVTGSSEIGVWAVTVLAVLILSMLFRLLLGESRRIAWMRRLFWGLHLVLWPLSVFAAVHVSGVLLEVAISPQRGVWLGHAGDAMLVVVAGMLIVDGLDIFLWQGIAQRKFGQSTPRILIASTTVLVYLATGYVIAAVIFDIPVTGALVSSGILLGVIGLSLQDTIRDVFSGLFISLERPFRIGDWIVTEDGRVGKVLQIDWRSTRLLSFNHTVYVVPNSKIANSIVENRAEPSPVYAHYFRVLMAPEAPTGLVTRVLLEAVLSSPYVLPEPPPSVRLVKAQQRPYEYRVVVHFESFELSWRGNADVQQRIHDYLKRVGLGVSGEAREVRYGRLEQLPAEEPSIQQLLEDIRIFQTLSSDELALLSKHVRARRYRSQDIIIREGDAGHSLLVITTGLVQVSHSSSQRGDIMVGRHGIGECIGEMSLLTGRPRNATVKAVTDCEIVEIPKESMNLLFERRPDLVDDLARIMSERHAAGELESEREAGNTDAITLQDIAEHLSRRIRSFFRLDAD